MLVKSPFASVPIIGGGPLTRDERLIFEQILARIACGVGCLVHDIYFHKSQRRPSALDVPVLNVANTVDQGMNMGQP